MDSVNNCEAIYKLIAVNYKCGRPEMAIVVKNMEKRNHTRIVSYCTFERKLIQICNGFY